MEINVHQAKTHLSRLLQRVAEGEEVTIARAGTPVARLVPVKQKKNPRPLGIDRGRIWFAEDSNSLPDDLLAAFYGGELPKNTKRRKHK